jgi:polyisoprenoid-binding protein YceI
MSLFPPTKLAASSCGTWHIDADASIVEFTVEERMAFVKRRTVTGCFPTVTGTIVLDEERPADSRVELTIDVRDVETGHAKRDKSLQGKDFFDSSRFPTITFVSRWCDAADTATGRSRATGYLTVRDVTREIELEVECDLSRQSVRLTTTTLLNRRDFGMTWGNAMFWIADEVRVHVSVEASQMIAARAA